MTGAAAGDSALGPAVVGPEQCRGGDPIPGVAAPMNSPEGIQACDECGLYDSDLDAAAALARHVPGGRVLYREASTGEMCEYVWPGTGAEVIASSTDPWIVDAYGRSVDWQERDLWTGDPTAIHPTAAADHRRPDPQREGTHAPMTSHSSDPQPVASGQQDLAAVATRTFGWNGDSVRVSAEVDAVVCWPPMPVAGGSVDLLLFALFDEGEREWVARVPTAAALHELAESWPGGTPADRIPGVVLRDGWPALPDPGRQTPG